MIFTNFSAICYQTRFPTQTVLYPPDERLSYVVSVKGEKNFLFRKEKEFFLRCCFFVRFHRFSRRIFLKLLTNVSRISSVAFGFGLVEMISV